MDKKLENGIIKIAKSMVTAVTNSSLYSAEHSQVKKHLEITHEHILDLLRSRDKVSFVVIEGELVADDQPMTADIFLSKFAGKLQGKSIGGLTFTEGLTQEELMNFINVLATSSTPDSEVSSSPHIRIGRVEVKTKGKAKTKAGYSIGAQEMFEFMEIYRNMEKNNKMDVTGMQNIIANIIRVLKKGINPLRALAPMKSFNEYTFIHSINVCILTISQAMHLGFEGQILYNIGIAALLHDVGKLFVPEEILSKDSKPSEEEWGIIREHPVKGAVYLLDIAGIPGLSVVVAFEHHMQYDFSGYPKVKQGWKQNPCSQMTALSDMFDAMMAYRKYKDTLTEEEILAIMGQKSGKAFNPLLLENFVKMFKRQGGNKKK